MVCSLPASNLLPKHRRLEKIPPLWQWAKVYRDKSSLSLTISTGSFVFGINLLLYICYDLCGSKTHPCNLVPYISTWIFSCFMQSQIQSHCCNFHRSMPKHLREWFKVNWECDDWTWCGKEWRASTRRPTGWGERGRRGCLAAALNRGRLDESQTQRGLSDVQCRHQSLEQENRNEARVWRTGEKRIAIFTH